MTATREDGASPFNLQVDSQTASSLVFAVDGKIRHDVAKGLSLFANLGVGYDVINDLASINALIAGQPGGYTTYYGIDQSPWLTRAGLALMGNPTPGLEYGVYYDVEYRTDLPEPDGFGQAALGVLILRASRKATVEHRGFFIGARLCRVSAPGPAGSQPCRVSLGACAGGTRCRRRTTGGGSGAGRQTSSLPGSSPWCPISRERSPSRRS